MPSLIGRNCLNRDSIEALSDCGRRIKGCGQGLSVPKAAQLSIQVGLAAYGQLVDSLGVGVVGAGPVRRKLWDGDGRQNTDNGHNDHQFDKSKTLLIIFLHFF
jgi:hypothetical protein